MISLPHKHLDVQTSQMELPRKITVRTLKREE